MKGWITILFLLIIYKGHSQVLKKRVPDKLVVLTFDDAAATHYSFVAPLLKQYGFGATFHVCEFPPDYNDTAKYMTWQQIGHLGKMGFEVASHTKTHKHVDKMTATELEEELAYIEKKCDSLQLPKPSTFAYPGYDTHPAALDVLKKRGYIFARAGGDRIYNPATDHPFLIPSFTTLKNNRDEILQALLQAKNGNIVVLTIHGVPDVAHDWVTTPPDLFREYLQYLHQHQYKVIAMKEVAQYVNVKKAVKEIKPDWQKKLK